GLEHGGAPGLGFTQCRELVVLCEADGSRNQRDMSWNHLRVHYDAELARTTVSEPDSVGGWRGTIYHQHLRFGILRNWIGANHGIAIPLLGRGTIARRVTTTRQSKNPSQRTWTPPTAQTPSAPPPPEP